MGRSYIRTRSDFRSSSRLHAVRLRTIIFLLNTNQIRRARVWTAPEATSIWFEIVQARKHELQQSVQEETFSFAVALAGDVTLTREQHAEWDNSARACLRDADRVRSTEQTQVMLIRLAVSPTHSPYKSVMDA